MKRVAVFCIPAHGHTNPMLPVAAALVRRGNRVRFYSFGIFEPKIRAAGAEFVPCDRFLPTLTEREEAGLKRVSTTEMTIQDLRITREMDAFLAEEFASFRPDVVFSDSVCFWGKLNAWKHRVPLVVSTSTFAFNQFSSEYMKHSPAEMADMILGLPRIAKELKSLEPLGYHVKSALSLVQSDNATDNIVYTSRRFQPYAESFSDCYLFAGPSVFAEGEPEKPAGRPLVYIAMGTVINDRPDFYRHCIDALKDLPAEILISCGNAVDPASFAPLPENIRMEHRVDQPEVLRRAGVFITHCGMNSVSESLYMATPMVLFPQTGEQEAVARRVREIGAGVDLKEETPEAIRAAVEEILQDPAYARAAAECSEDFRSCRGPEGAAEMIETAPHGSSGRDIPAELNKWAMKIRVACTVGIAALCLLLSRLTGWGWLWIPAVAAGILLDPFCKRLQKRRYERIVKEMREQKRA